MENRVVKILRLIACLIVFMQLEVYAVKDKPCAAREVVNRSVICVCNETYCDEITREVPDNNRFVYYQTSEGGLRFNKSKRKYSTSNATSYVTLELDLNTKYQKLFGFGGAITDSAAINWKSLPTSLQNFMINSYFSNKGLQYTILRVPIGGTDFSTHQYAYNDQPEDDMRLSNFSLTYEDFYLKIPMIKAGMAVSSTKIKIVSTCWSPPNWMKKETEFTHCGRLHEKYFQTYADYHFKFIEQYNEQGIPIWAITTTNEPVNGFLPMRKINCLGWSAFSMGRWISTYLGPRIRNSIYKDVKILAVDDQRFTLPLWYSEMIEVNPISLHYIDGVAVHFYGDMATPPDVFETITKLHPDKFILATEACEGAYPWDKPNVDLGSWKRAVHYIKDIIEDLLYGVTGWLDWNVCLNEKGGPTWIDNFVDSPIIVSAKNKEFYKQPMFYALGHFSKFLPPGSQRINVNLYSCRDKEELERITNVAFLTPLNTVVVVIYNDGPEVELAIHFKNMYALVHAEQNAIVTLELCNEK